MFLTNRLVFVGFSLEDPELGYLLRLTNTRFGQQRPRHSAFLARGTGRSPQGTVHYATSWAADH
jgi:hypothetical protein